MLHSHYHTHRLSPNYPVPLSFAHNPSKSLNFLHKPTILHSVSVSAHPPLSSSWLVQLAELTTLTEEGPVELPLSDPSIFAITQEASLIQVATTVLLTGAITVFLFRSVRRRVKLAKELKFRSSGKKNSLKKEELGNLKGMGSSAAIRVKRKAPPSPDQALIGAVLAGVIAIILYKFTITIEAALNRQTLSDNFSVRQITVSIRTIINGLCYLATFVYGIPSIGLFLYSGQLAMNSFMDSNQMQTEIKSTELLSLSNSAVESAKEHIELSSRKQEDQSSNNAK